MLVSCPSLHHHIKSHGVKETQKPLIKLWPLFLCPFILNHKIHHSWEMCAVSIPKLQHCLLILILVEIGFLASEH